MIIAHIDVKKIVIQILISVILLVGSGFLVYKNFVKKDKKDYYLIPVHKDKKVEEGAFEQVIRVLDPEDLDIGTSSYDWFG